MANQDRTSLKGFFETGDIPSEGQFADLIDSFLNKTDDSDQIVPAPTTGDAGKIPRIKSDESGWENVPFSNFTDTYGLYQIDGSASASDLNSLITEVSNNGGGYIFIDGTITCGSQIQLQSDVHFIGGTLQLGYNGDLIDYSAQRWSFTNVVFDGNKANFSGNGFNRNTHSTSVRYFKLSQCDFQNFSGHAFIHRSTGNYIIEATSFQGCDDYAIYETTSTQGDSTRYGAYIKCESRNSKGIVLSEGANEVDYFFRGQSITEHGYKIENTTYGIESNVYDGNFTNLDGSALWSDRNLSRCDIFMKASDTCKSPPAQYGGRDPSQVYINNPSNSFITFSRGAITNSGATPDIAVDDVQDTVQATVQSNFQFTGEIKGGNWFFENLQSVSGATLSTDKHVGLNIDKSGSNRPEISSGGRGGIRLGWQLDAVSSSGTISTDTTYDRVDASGGAITRTLPDPANVLDNAEITVQKFDSSGNAVTINEATSGTSLFANKTELTSQYDAVTFISIGPNWYQK